MAVSRATIASRCKKVQSSCCALFGITIKHAKLSIHLHIHITIQPSNKKYRADKEIKYNTKTAKSYYIHVELKRGKGFSQPEYLSSSSIFHKGHVYR